MTCEEFLELAAAYALGILDETERAACLAHLTQAEHRGCLEAIADASDISAKLVVTLPARPPSPDVWRAIESRISAGDQTPKDAAPGGPADSAGAASLSSSGVPTGMPLARAVTAPRVWRELAGWFVAAAVVGFHLYSVPVDPNRVATAGEDPPGPLDPQAPSSDSTRDSGRQAMSLMIVPGTRLSAFTAQREGVGDASIMLNVGEKRAVVVARARKTEPPEGLRLWTVRGQLPPTSLGSLTPAPSGQGMQLAVTSLGATLFEPALPDRLLISVDTPDARAPQSVLLSASLR